MRSTTGWWIVGLLALSLVACGTSDTTSGTGDRSGEDGGNTSDVGTFDDVGSGDVGVGDDDGGAPACDPGEQRCRGGVRSTCSRNGVWIQDPCPPGTLCQPGGICEELVTVCGDGVCEPGEEFGVCPQDCAQCGDGICEPGEAESGCRADCPVDSCGNGVCERGEDPMVCPVDCIEDTCGDGVCEFEEFDRCRQDCRGACRSDMDCEAGWFCNDIEASTGIGLCPGPRHPGLWSARSVPHRQPMCGGRVLHESMYVRADNNRAVDADRGGVGDGE